MIYLKNQLNYTIKEGLYLIRNNNSYSIKQNENELIELYSNEDMDSYIFFSYNNKYIVIWETYYDCPITTVLAAYDIENKKIIDCSNSYTNKELVEGVVKKQRCMYDVVASILMDTELMIDKNRLYNFMSFIINKRVNESNFHKYTSIIKDYIISCYPELESQKIYTNKKELLALNEQYGIDYFIFNQMEHNIDGLKYIKNNEFVKIIKVLK